MSARRMLSAPAMSRTAFGCKSVGVASGAIRSDLASRAVICSLLRVFQRDTETLRAAALTRQQGQRRSVASHATRSLIELLVLPICKCSAIERRRATCLLKCDSVLTSRCGRLTLIAGKCANLCQEYSDGSPRQFIC